jgi:outer membrane protein insertion porin family
VARRALQVILILGLFHPPAFCAPEDYEGKTVVAIEFQPPLQPYPMTGLLGMLPLKTGQPLRLADVRTAIDRLNATGRYADIQVDAENRDGGVAIRFLTQDNYFLGRVTVEGVPEPPSTGVLVNTTGLELGRLYTDADAQHALEHLRQILSSNGFFRSRIEPRYEHDPKTQQVFVRFVVTPGDRARYTWPLVTGHPDRSAGEITNLTHWRRIWFLGWRTVTDARTQSGVSRVRRSYQKQERLMARVQLTKMDYEPDTNRAQSTLNLEAGPVIDVRTEGAKLSQGKLRQLVPIYEEQSVDRDLLVEGARNLTEYFESQGYFDVKVDFRSNLDTAAERTDGMANHRDRRETIVYSIDRGLRHKVIGIEIRGNHYFDQETLLERMYVRPASLIQFRYGRYSDNFLRRDVAAIESLYRSNGFRDVEVTSRVQHGMGGNEARMMVYIDVKEGPQWLVHALVLEGVSKTHEPALLGLVQSIKGQPFAEATAAIDRDTILEYYYNSGYADATFQYSFEPSAEPHHVDLKYTVQEGSQRFVRSVLISGLKTTDPNLVEERVRLNPGDPLSRNDMLETQRSLYNLGIFAKVDMALQNPDGQEREKYVLLQADESRRYTVTGGIGAEIAKIGGTAGVPTDPAGKAGFSPRVYLNLTRRNAFGEGHIVSLTSRVSNLQQRSVLTYQAPQFRGNPDLNLTFSATYDQSRNVRTFTSRRQEGAVQIGQHISRSETFLYRFTYRKVNISDLVINPLIFPQFASSIRIGMLGGSYIQDRRDDPTDATKGTYTTLDMGWASRVFGSQSDFTSFTGRNATYYPFGAGRRYVLARSLTFGWQQTLGRTLSIPLAERFFAGGPTSHRGFPQNQAGPRDPNSGFPLGGAALLLNQTEWRFPLIGENIRGVLFHDAGNVYPGLDTISFRIRQRNLTDFTYMVHAVGFGVRYRTPVGPVRVDLAYVPNSPRFYGLKGTTDELIAGKGIPQLQRISRFQFQFSLGQAF